MVKKKGLLFLLRSTYVKVLVAISLIALLFGGVIFSHYYKIYSTILDRRLSGEVFKHTAKIYATPYKLYPGQVITNDDIVLRLRRAGLEETLGRPFEDLVYQRLNSADQQNSIIVSPTGADDFRIDLSDGIIQQLVEERTNFDLLEVSLPPELVTNMFDDTRTKRRLVEWEQIPPHLSDALIAAEDQRFFRHFGIDLIRAGGAFVATYVRGQRLEGASTLTMQLAGSFFLNRRERTWSRKLPEIFIALLLEQRLTKPQILTMYANEIYLGNRGSFAINGFGEAAAAYFGKDVSDLTVSESATLVGIIPSPNAYSPWRHMDRAIQRRDLVLQAMNRLEMINATQLVDAQSSELKLAEVEIDASEAPYMIDFIRDELLTDFSEEELINDRLHIYTTLDPDLQRVAVQAVASGIVNVDAQLEVLEQRGEMDADRPEVQAALIVLDPHSGEIRAMVGGRDYGASQYNRITEAFRQPGSIFKPFVYAAAFETAWNPLITENTILREDGEPRELTQSETGKDPAAITNPGSQSPGNAARAKNGHVEGLTIEGPLRPITMREMIDRIEALEEEAADGLLEDLEDLHLSELPIQEEPGTLRDAAIVTPVTTVMDEPTIFFYEDEKFYRPNNYKDVFHGMITVREALQRSWNVPTVKVAQRIGYGRVTELAHRVGLNADIKPYPSVALGAFEVTPLEMAGAYTPFANEGVRVEPRALRQIVDDDGNTLKRYEMVSEEVIRPELAGLMTNLLQGVINGGTGIGVRMRGFTLPAAGKTGTDSDGWFAGYTKNLLAIAWVGFDDNRELNLEGSQSALPIWAAFMKSADELYPVRDPEDSTEFDFLEPPGVEIATIDEHTLSLATPNCTDSFVQAFIYGTAPRSFCPLHSFSSRFFLSKSSSPSDLQKTQRQ